MTAAKRLVLFGFVAVAAVAAGYCTAVDWPLFPPPSGGKVARPPSDFTLPDLDGRKRSLKDWRGQVVLLNFWATWCPPCREEIPLFLDMQRRYGDKGLQIVGVSVDDAAAVVAYARRLKINYPLLLAENEGLDLMASYGNSHGSLPYSVLIGADGAILARKLGAYGRKELESALISAITAAKNLQTIKN
jgi:peroxiredoxin